jgi:hypothetical protein
MADKQINIVIGADINKLEKGFKDAVRIIGASGKTIDSEMQAVVESIEKDFERIANSPNTKRTVAQLQNLALKVQALGPEFEDMANKIIKSAGQIKDKVGDAGDKIKYFSSDTRRMDAVVSAAQGIAGAFGVAQGAAALFGSENEDLQKTMLKVQGAIAVMNGIQAIQNVLKEESAAITGFQALQEEALALATYASASAMNAFKVALAATGIGLAVVGIGLLISKFMEQSEKQAKAAEIAKKYRDELIKNTTEAETNGRTLAVYLGIVKNTNRSDAERTVALRKLNELGVATSDINIKSSESLSLLTQRTNDYIDVLKKKAIAESFNLEIADAAKKLNEAKNNPVRLKEEQRAEEALGRAIKNNSKVYEFTQARDAVRLAHKKEISKADAELTAVITKQAAAVNDLVAAESKVKTEKDIANAGKGGKDTKKDQEDKAKKALKMQEDNLDSRKSLIDAEINAEKSLALGIAKTDAEKLQIEFDAKEKLLNIQEVYLLQKEALKNVEEQNAESLNNNIAALDAEHLANKADFDAKMKLAKAKEVEDGKKTNEEIQKVAQEKLSYIKESERREIDAINNHFQQLENIQTERFQKGLISEKAYNMAILQLQLERAKSTLQAMKDAGDLNTAEVEKQIIELQGKISNGLKGVDDVTKKFNDSMKSAFTSMAQGGFEGIGQAIGDSIMNGTSAMEGAFKSILLSVAAFGEAYGKALIASAIASEAFEKFLITNPVLAIGAGVALIAASTIVRSVASKGPTAFADGGIVSGPTLGLVGEYANASTNPEVIAPLDKLKGMLMPMSGGNFPMSMETRFDGRDLYLAVKKYERDSRRG